MLAKKLNNPSYSLSGTLLQPVRHMKNGVLEPEDGGEAVDKAGKANGKHLKKLKEWNMREFWDTMKELSLCIYGQ